MSKTLVDLDDVALAMAMAHYGTTIKREAVNRALREVAERRAEATADLEGWVVDVGARLGAGEMDVAWRE